MATAVGRLRNSDIERQTKGFYPKRFTLILYSLFAFNIVFPLVDVPLVGLSITALFFALITLEIVFRSKYLSFRRYSRWLLPVCGIGLAICLSLTINGLAGNLEFGVSSLLSIAQSTYWLLVFVITMVLVANLNEEDVRSLVIVVGVSIMIVGLLRLFEATAYERVGPSTSRILSQNAYGILFSTFAPFAFVLVLLVRSNFMRLISVVGFLALIIAIVLNGSRSSWLTVSVGLSVVAGLILITQRRHILPVFAVLGLIFFAGGFVIANISVDTLEPIILRFETLQQYEEDRSYLIRLLMQQKSIELFENNPVFGIGSGQFRNYYIALDLSGTPFTHDRLSRFNQIASHNSYAQYLAEQGVFGMIPLLALLLQLVLRGLRTVLGYNSQGFVWYVAVYAALLSMSIHLWSIDNFRTSSTWFIYGLVAGMIERNQMQKNCVNATNS